MAPLLFKSIIILCLLFIVFNLALALVRMVREKPDNTVPMTRYLGRRVALSAVVILFLILALKLGWVVPNQRPY
ncbi:hypothetical protein A9264_09545 [Vibrio sp. UCD-FRSSP16_10]|uniref:DUF2909 domain-containing protein n=1 Tax=unclassified Vibrio TaxID=2614977 RepID=UPI0007FC8543|nr:MULTISPECIES: DUF2909 domain-containing protein [unclassified Vibrio]OBT16964.1 hypothetical protein A9260_09770 [Vibrio sp. UCD-FRSSP16_30]OBT21955.1 hypothetical protein A9264_09545 [Vibrio sp. UCD-FRSSP16_10]